MIVTTNGNNPPERGGPAPAAPAMISVWFFVGATFAFAAPTIFLGEAELWVRLVFIGVGLVLVVLGGVQFGREITARRQGGTPPTEPR